MYHRQRRISFETLECRRVLSAVNIPVDLTAEPSDLVSVPVEIDDTEGVRAVEIEINYDTELLDTDADSITAGSAWGAESAEVVASVDDDAGTIVVWVSAADGLDSGSGSLLDIEFTVSSDAVVGESTEIDLAEVVINEGEIAVDPEPETGEDSTDGLITFVEIEADASISGVVYADANQNDQVDESEVIPGATITLVNEDTGEEWETYTDENGAYEFLELAAGSYTIEQQQPAAFLDGGNNEISVDLSNGEDLTDQNFQEIGLKPEYVFNRLFTTLAIPVASTQWTEAVEEIVENAGTETDSAETSAEASASETADASQGEAVAAKAVAATSDSVSANSTAAGSGSVSGVVYADINENDQPDELEGIPGVQIVLVNEDTGEQWETYTGDDGSYEFLDLAAGTYTITEQQPSAFLDGGSNEISLALADSESLADQNFLELGLTAESVSNELLTSLALPIGSDAWNEAIAQIIEEGDSA